VLWNLTGDTGTDTDEIESALQDWADGVDVASVSRDGDVVHFSSCDPGDALPPPLHRTETGSPVTALEFRAQLATELESEGTDLDTGLCAADGFIEGYGVDAIQQLNDDLTADPTGGFPDDAEQALIAAYQAC
jgi:hypothetical protein